MKHILRSQQFSRAQLEELFAEANQLNKMFDDPALRVGLGQSLRGKVMFPIFWEPSTRTRMSFCAAAGHLGMSIYWTDAAGRYSSAAKGETLEDTARTLAALRPHVIVLRHPENGAAARAVRLIKQFGHEAAVINAGDGKGQHPTQALLDLYTIQRELGRLDNLSVTVGGDLLNGRTVHSLVYLLAKFKNIKFTFISPKNLRMKKGIKNYLQRHGIPFRETTNMYSALRSADVVYWTRIQKERGSENTTLDLTIGPRQMRWMKKKSCLLHPLPRVDEISTEVDKDPRAAYFRQIEYGLFVRMALLKQIAA